jgi:hypothetical protein
MSSYETCRECDSETGRAGASEDSLYHSYVGPFCEDCYDDWPDKIEAELAKVRREFRDFRAGQAVSVPEWIKCSERLPKINSPVVVARISDNDGKPCLDSGVAALQPNNGWIGLGVFYRPKIDAGTIYQNDFSVMDVTHWMPLPKPPKQEKSQ